MGLEELKLPIFEEAKFATPNEDIKTMVETFEKLYSKVALIMSPQLAQVESFVFSHLPNYVVFNN